MNQDSLLEKTHSRRNVLKMGLGAATAVAVGYGAEKTRADEKTLTEFKAEHHPYCSDSLKRVNVGKWSVPFREVIQEDGVRAASQEAGIDTQSPEAHKWDAVANQILREKWNIPQGLTIHVGIYQDSMIYTLQGQKYEALAITRRNWEDSVPTPEAHILLSKRILSMSDEEIIDLLTHEDGHALKTWYPGEHNPDENSVMYWFFTKAGKPITAKDHESVRYDYKTGKEKVSQVPRPDGMVRQGVIPHLAKDNK